MEHRFSVGYLVLAFGIGLASSSAVYSHSGGLDANGCHAGSRPYHCHRAQTSNKSADVNSNGCLRTYVGVCIKPGSDVDCAGGSGNGPRYVRGPFRVTGGDPYGLDRDKDGIACE